MTPPLSDDDFRKVVDLTPLVAIDLVVTDAEGSVLLGKRRNRPAQDAWFVPGGRIFKGESLDAAFERISQAELGQACSRDNARLLNVFEHFYDDSVFGPAGTGPTTHYVVIAYAVSLDTRVIAPPDRQHSHYRWQALDDALTDKSIHANSRAYFPYLLGMNRAAIFTVRERSS